MASAREFREFAQECMDWARTAKSDQEHNIFLQMAQTWIEAARRLEKPAAKGLVGRLEKPAKSASQAPHNYRSTSA